MGVYFMYALWLHVVRINSYLKIFVINVELRTWLVCDLSSRVRCINGADSRLLRGRLIGTRWDGRYECGSRRA